MLVATGVVCAAAPTAAQAVERCRAGGNAYDAVVAAALVETVLLPPKCGFGGDLIAIHPEGSRPPHPRPTRHRRSTRRPSRRWRAGGWREVGPDDGWSAGSRGRICRTGGPWSAGRAPLVAPPSNRGQGLPWAAVCSRLSVQAAALVREMNPEGLRLLPRRVPIGRATITRLPGSGGVLRGVRRPRCRASWKVRSVTEVVAAVRTWRGVGPARSFGFARPSGHGVREPHRPRGRVTTWATPAPTHGPSLLDAVARTRVDVIPQTYCVR